MQQIFLGLGAVTTKTYVDDVFSTYVYKGNSTARSITNNINLTDNEGMVWIKNRSSANNSVIQDTIRGAGATKKLCSNSNKHENSGVNSDTRDGYISAFNNNGFSLDRSGSAAGYDWQNVNKNSNDYAAWTFLKKPGFLDIVTYTGNGTAGHQIAHELGCMPGMVIVKRRSGEAGDWLIWHRGVHPTDAGDYFLSLDTNFQAYDNSNIWNDTNPTANHFTVGGEAGANANGAELVAYVFAGGESTSATARSVFFDGDDDRLTFSATSDFAFGTGDFTLECWAKRAEDNDAYSRLMAFGPYWNNNDSNGIAFDDGDHANKITFSSYRNINQGDVPSNGRVLVSNSNVYTGHWYHVAVTRSSGVFRLFINGILEDTDSSITSRATEASATNTMAIAGTVDRMVSEPFDGNISNVRVVKGTALYTSSFRPPTKPLTNVTNTKLLCCNNSSTTGSTVTPGTIVADGSPIAKTDSPFDDPAAFTFGDAGDQNVIKTGSYTGNGNADGPEVYLGFEPSWVMLKNTTGTGKWMMADSMRGAVTGGDDPYLDASDSAAEYTTYDWIEFTSTGFKLKNTGAALNTDGSNYVYLCIRRPDGYVGKPPELGTSVFAMDTGNSSETIPVFDSGFPVDFAFMRIFAGAQEWYTSARLISGKRLFTDGENAEASLDGMTFDSSSGWAKKGSTYSWGNTYQSWMWKRHAGFDVVCYDGSGGNQTQKHSLGQVPEMIFTKPRSFSDWWGVYHVGTGNNKLLRLNNSDAAYVDAYPWQSTTPTSTVFYLGLNNAINKSGEKYLALLFSSVDGISKVGYFDGSSSTQTITTGFAPRFLILKCASHGGDWFVFDTVRGWSSGNDQFLMLNANTAQGAYDYGAPTSTGFTLTVHNDHNNAGRTYIYYAHA